MKWIALLLFLALIPTLSIWLRTSPKNAPIVWGLLGFLPFVLGPWHLMVAPYATPLWDGYVKGWEFSLLDAIAIAVILGTRGSWPRLTLAIPFLSYICVATVAAIWEAKFVALAIAYPIQLCRAFLVFVAVARISIDVRGERAVVSGLILGIVVQAAYAIVARAGGALQTGGSLGHQNLLGFVSHPVLMTSLAMFLSVRFPRTAFLGIFAGLVVVILTASRATLALSGVGLIFTLILAMLVRPSSRKIAIGLIAVLVLVASFPVANVVMQERLQAHGQTFFAEDKEREAFKRAAWAIIRANPFGVGPNHYVFIANTEGYSANAGVAWRSQSRSTNVHNSYLLVWAETGLLGLIAFLALLTSGAWQAFRSAFRHRRQPGAEILIGLGCGILAMALHGLFEWMFVVYSTQYVLACALGLVTGIRSRFDAASRTQRRTRGIADSSQRIPETFSSGAFASQ